MVRCAIKREINSGDARQKLMSRKHHDGPKKAKAGPRKKTALELADADLDEIHTAVKGEAIDFASLAETLQTEMRDVESKASKISGTPLSKPKPPGAKPNIDVAIPKPQPPQAPNPQAPKIAPLPVTIRSVDEIGEDPLIKPGKKAAGRKKAAARKGPISEDDLPDFLETPPIIKKRPGRPKKTVLKQAVPKQGIVREPSNAVTARGTDSVYVVELIYDNPMMFKKILAAGSAIDVDQVRVCFTADELILFAVNEKTNNMLHARVYGARVNSYYSGNPKLEIGLKLDLITNVISTINNENSKIHISTPERRQREKIFISSSNDQSAMLGRWEINVLPLDDYDWAVNEILDAESTYPIRFEIPFKDFKKIVSDAKTCKGNIIHIEKEAEERAVRFSYTFQTNDGRGDVLLNDSEKIKLRCDMGDMDIFSTSVYTEYIKAFSATLLSDSVEISADQNRHLIFTSYLDNDITVDKKIIPGTERCQLKVLIDLVRAP